LTMENLPNVVNLSENWEGSMADMSISAKTLETRKEILSLERRVGFRRFCVNTEVDSVWTPSAGKKKKKKDDDRGSPQPSCPVPPPSKSLESLEEVDCLLYSRLTFPLTDPIQLNKMAAPEILAYDVIAVEPDNEKLLHKVCTESEHVDVITFNYLAGNAPAFKVQPGIVKVAQERGIHFEIAVGPGLRATANAKQNLISYGRRIVAATKGKNIILTNGAVKASEVRGPYDLMNLGVLFGMNQSQAKDAVTRNFDAVLRHSLTRKNAGGVITFTKSSLISQKTKDQLAQLRQIKALISDEAAKRAAGHGGAEKTDSQNGAVSADEKLNGSNPEPNDQIIATGETGSEKRKAVDPLIDSDTESKKARLDD